MSVTGCDSAIKALHKRYLEACQEGNIDQATYYMNARDAKLEERWSLMEDLT